MGKNDSFVPKSIEIWLHSMEHFRRRQCFLSFFFFLVREVKKRKGKLNEDLDLTMGQIVFYDYDDLGFNSNLGVSAF